MTNNGTKELEGPLDPNSVNRNIVQKYGRETGFEAQVNGLCAHSPRATAATNALSHEADIAKVQECWATRMYRPHASTIGEDAAGGQSDVLGEILKNAEIAVGGLSIAIVR